MARVNLPPLTRSLLVTLIIFTLLNAIIAPEYTALGPFTRTGHGTPYISIIPGASWRYPWTFATATFVEQNVFGLIVSGLTLFYGGRYLERAWSSAEYAKFIVIVGMIPNLLCFALYIFLFAISKSEKALYGASFLGESSHTNRYAQKRNSLRQHRHTSRLPRRLRSISDR